MSDKIKMAHDLLDAAQVFNADGTHPQFLERLRMLIAECDRLRKAGPKDSIQDEITRYKSLPLLERLRDRGDLMKRVPLGVVHTIAEAADEIERLREAGLYMTMTLGGAAWPGVEEEDGWTREQIRKLFEDVCERWPELDPRR
jgi:hypothetical protein